MDLVKGFEEPPEGRRERKRRETRTRIADAAMALFQARGFTAVTVDEIAEAADVSKPTFFNYFATKEDVVIAWQDKFALTLAEAVASRPAQETLPEAVEAAMADALIRAATPESAAITALIRATPALTARNQVKYVNLEKALSEALLAREPDADLLEVKLLSMITIGALRVATDAWRIPDDAAGLDVQAFTRDICHVLSLALGKSRSSTYTPA